ncbi:unnamed protein product [Fusarium graminearum]|uniref:Uncharacterized protein n=1 Tax=Gibberella zeae TaxID=5518 RepID=A0A4E9DZX1_GIBZA|nr:unnamed protein product [Fusarium graminearum]CAF3548511.1 unnamed protein product [Fusarium graminearum]CAG1964376.1 unnamed protein product [Fusarium graminearum]CAG1985716.1 unnamed protein product [Fusarium graminearum]
MNNTAHIVPNQVYIRLVKTAHGFLATQEVKFCASAACRFPLGTQRQEVIPDLYLFDAPG